VFPGIWSLFPHLTIFENMPSCRAAALAGKPNRRSRQGIYSNWCICRPPSFAARLPRVVGSEQRGHASRATVTAAGWAPDRNHAPR